MKSVDTAGPRVHFHVPIYSSVAILFGVMLLLSSISDMERSKYNGEKLGSERNQLWISTALEAADQTGESGPYDSSSSLS